MSLTLNPLAPPFRPAPTTTHTTSHANADLFPGRLLNPEAKTFQPLPLPATSHPFVCFNARSIRNKVAELTDFCSTWDPLFVSITETWLHGAQIFSIPGYDCYRRDRPTTENKTNRSELLAYGGVAPLVKSGVFPSVIHRSDLHAPNFEATFVEIEFPLKGTGTQTFGSGKSLLIGSLYHPPSNTAAAIDTFCNSLQRCLTVVKATTSAVVLMGDFNARCSDWEGDITDTAGHQLRCLLKIFSLEQLVNFPTHESASGPGAALDLVITDIPHAIDDLHAEAPMGQSDHCIVVGKIKMSQSPQSPVSEQKQLPHRSNLASLNISSVPNETAVALNERLFHIDLEAVLQLHRGDPSLSADMLYDTLEEILQSYFCMTHLCDGRKH